MTFTNLWYISVFTMNQKQLHTTEWGFSILIFWWGNINLDDKVSFLKWIWYKKDIYVKNTRRQYWMIWQMDNIHSSIRRFLFKTLCFLINILSCLLLDLLGNYPILYLKCIWVTFWTEFFKKKTPVNWKVLFPQNW